MANKKKTSNKTSNKTAPASNKGAALAWISNRAKQMQAKNPNACWTELISKASAEYRDKKR